MNETTAHLITMFGSYFRVDAVPVLRTEDESRFHTVTYNYYQQLNGYKHLKSLGIGYAFYQVQYFKEIIRGHKTKEYIERVLVEVLHTEFDRDANQVIYTFGWLLGE